MKNNRIKLRVFFIGGLFITIMLHTALWLHYSSKEFIAPILISSIIFEIFFISVSVFMFFGYEKLKSLIIRDPMTKIFNWEHMKNSIETELERFKRMEECFALIYFDIDNFKALNDEHGHYSGDKVLMQLVSVVQTVIRPYDIFGRLGGEEFCILLPQTNREEVLIIAERIRSQIEQINENKKLKITVSMGITLSQIEDTYSSIYKRVDKSMYAAKIRGKNRIVFD